MPDLLLHRVEVPDHERDVSEDPAYPRLELRVHLVGETAVDLEVHEGLAALGLPAGHHLDEATLLVSDGADDRVEEALDREPSRRELLGDRVDEEGRVIGGDLDDGSVAPVAVVLEVGVEHADGGCLEATAVRELEGGGRERVQLVRRDLFEVVVGQPSQQRASEDLEGFGPSRLGLPGDPSEHLLDLGMELGGCPGGRRLFDRVRHWRSRHPPG